MSWWPEHYAPFWCEENAWHLCVDPRIGEDAHVVVISNAARAVALWRQRAAEQPGAPVLWDYHVIVVAQHEGATTVWDLDTTIGFGIEAARYRAETFVVPTRAVLQPRFRVLAAAEYRERFASDRRHMRDRAGGWQQPPPEWPPIGTGHTLDALIDADDPAFGPWRTLEDLGW